MKIEKRLQLFIFKFISYHDRYCIVIAVVKLKQKSSLVNGVRLYLEKGSERIENARVIYEQMQAEAGTREQLPERRLRRAPIAHVAAQSAHPSICVRELHVHSDVHTRATLFFISCNSEYIRAEASIK